MFNHIEYKLKGNEFKLLQYLKIRRGDTREEMAFQLNISERGLCNNINTLEDLNIISKHAKGTAMQHGFFYVINNVEEWTL